MIVLRKVTSEDWKILLDWRNDEETQRNSHSTVPVAEATHKTWLNKVLADPNTQLFIAEENGIPVGTTRADFHQPQNDYLLSWTIAPHARGKGIGKLMVKAMAEMLNGRIRAEIKSGNIASVKIAEFAGLSLKKDDHQVLYFSNY